MPEVTVEAMDGDLALSAARRDELCARADAYVADMIAEHGEPTPEEEARAQAFVDRLIGATGPA